MIRHRASLCCRRAPSGRPLSGEVDSGGMAVLRPLRYCPHDAHQRYRPGTGRPACLRPAAGRGLADRCLDIDTVRTHARQTSCPGPGPAAGRRACCQASAVLATHNPQVSDVVAVAANAVTYNMTLQGRGCTRSVHRVDFDGTWYRTRDDQPGQRGPDLAVHARDAQRAGIPATTALRASERWMTRPSGGRAATTPRARWLRSSPTSET